MGENFKFNHWIFLTAFVAILLTSLTIILCVLHLTIDDGVDGEYRASLVPRRIEKTVHAWLKRARGGARGGMIPQALPRACSRHIIGNTLSVLLSHPLLHNCPLQLPFFPPILSPLLSNVSLCKNKYNRSFSIYFRRMRFNCLHK